MNEDTIHHEEWTELHRRIRTYLLNVVSSGDCDDKMMAVALRYLAQFKPAESMEDIKKGEGDLKKVASSLPFKQAQG